MEAQPLPTIVVPYAYPGAPVPPVPQNYQQWTVDEQGGKKPCWKLLLERLAREHAHLQSEEFNAFAAELDGGRKEILLSERGTRKNHPYANLDHKVQESDFLVGANI
jgi:hypothetical protein